MYPDLEPSRGCGLDARLKILLTAGFVAVIVVTHDWVVLSVAALLLALPVCLSLRIIPAISAKLIRIIAMLALIDLSMLLASGQRSGGLFGQITLRGTMISIAIMLLVGSRRRGELTDALRWFRLPELLIDVVGFTFRYLGMLREEQHRLWRASQSRTGASSRWTSFRILGLLTAVLFVRAHDRSQRVYAAMCARGWGRRTSEGS